MISVVLSVILELLYVLLVENVKKEADKFNFNNKKQLIKDTREGV